jgi:hypothetical protein
MLITWATDLPKFIFQNIWLDINPIFWIFSFLNLMETIFLSCTNNRKYYIKLILIKLNLTHDEKSNSVENIWISEAVLFHTLPVSHKL